MPDIRSHHTLSIHRSVGALTLDVDLILQADWTILFGPSGSGKSSILRAAAGLLGKRDIRFTRATQVLQDDNTFTPAHLRNLRWAPQSASLFPHLNVRDNIRFGATPTSAPSENLDELIALFHIEPLLDRRPAQLSGGEAQRVSLARAFAAPQCKLMLLDEPFTGIDRELRDQLLPAMRSCLCDRAIPVISVTHDVEEAFLLQADVIQLREGHIETQGSAATVLHSERSRLLRSIAI